jgi:hypothetical protein
MSDREFCQVWFNKHQTSLSCMDVFGFVSHVFWLSVKFGVRDVRIMLLIIFVARTHARIHYIHLCAVKPYDIHNVKKASLNCVLRHGIQNFQFYILMAGNFRVLPECIPSQLLLCTASGVRLLNV